MILHNLLIDNFLNEESNTTNFMVDQEVMAGKF